MNLWQRLSAWRRRRRRGQAAKKANSPLREFVYLDEVSVFSLVASRLGPVAVEFTNTETANLQEDITGSIGASAGVAKTEMGSRMSSTRTKGSQVLRKSIIQTTFKELYELTKPSFIMKTDRTGDKPPPCATVSAIEATMETALARGWIIDPRSLSRGSLFEAEIELDADGIFRISTVVSSILELVQEHPAVFNISDLGDLPAGGRLLERLLAGLVPIRGRSVDYCVARIGDSDWIVHSGMIDGLADRTEAMIRNLYIVGVAEQALFWKDIRRVLFSSSRHHVMCRVAEDGIRTSWTPVKLVNVLATINPDLGTQLRDVLQTAFTPMQMAPVTTTDQNASSIPIRAALVAYAELTARAHGREIGEETLAAIEPIQVAHGRGFRTHDERRRAFEDVANLLNGTLSLEVDAQTAAEYREQALTIAGFGPGGEILKPAIEILPLNQAVPILPSECFVDSEFVAIYW